MEATQVKLTPLLILKAKTPSENGSMSSCPGRLKSTPSVFKESEQLISEAEEVFRDLRVTYMVRPPKQEIPFRAKLMRTSEVQSALSKFGAMTDTTGWFKRKVTTNGFHLKPSQTFQVRLATQINSNVSVSTTHSSRKGNGQKSSPSVSLLLSALR